MTKEEYKEHLHDIIMMTFQAEHDMLEKYPLTKEDLADHRMTLDEYVDKVADVILEHTDLSKIYDE